MSGCKRDDVLRYLRGRGERWATGEWRTEADIGEWIDGASDGLHMRTQGERGENGARAAWKEGRMPMPIMYKLTHLVGKYVTRTVFGELPCKTAAAMPQKQAK